MESIHDCLCVYTGTIHASALAWAAPAKHLLHRLCHGSQPPSSVHLFFPYLCSGKAGWKKGASVFNRRYGKWGGVSQEEVQQVGTKLDMVWHCGKELQREKMKGRKTVMGVHSAWPAGQADKEGISQMDMPAKHKFMYSKSQPLPPSAFLLTLVPSSDQNRTRQDWSEAYKSPSAFKGSGGCVCVEYLKRWQKQMKEENTGSRNISG